MPDCKITNQPFPISNKEIDFCKRMGLPLPNICFQERLRKLMAMRNEWKLYKRKCSASGQEILSAYTPESPFMVYKNDIWWGDSWDALQYGRDFNPTKSFFEQFKELQLVVPREGTSVFNCENCDYNSHIRQSKNCYLNSLIVGCEDVYYSYWVVNDKDIFDSLHTHDSTLCYWCNQLVNGYNCIFVEESKDCNDCYFSYQLRGCDHCIFCTNLSNKSYQILNKPATKEEFEKIKSDLLNGSWDNWQKACDHYAKIKLQAPNRCVHNINCENCTGDHLYNCRNCENCYESFDTEDATNTVSMANSKDIYGCYSAGWPGCEMIGNSVVTRGSQFIAFCTYTWFSNNLIYCDSCVSCEYCFGCIGLKHKKYCILNKQYTQKEYEKLKSEIIGIMIEKGEWGEIFPPYISPFAYNETSAQDFLPVEKEKAISMGYKWKEQEKNTEHSLPNNIDIFSCQTCKKNYRIIQKELDFYKKQNLPIPHECSTCRHKRRFVTRNPLKLFTRTCAKCGIETESTYDPIRPEIVYCEKCYLENI